MGFRRVLVRKCVFRSNLAEYWIRRTCWNPGAGHGPQNFGSKGLTRKIFRLKDLALLISLNFGYHPRICDQRVIFRIVRVKILISKSLAGGDLRLSSQNLEPVRLTRKTLLNKHLAKGFGDHDHAFWLWQ